MDVLIWHHSWDYPDHENHIKEIARLHNLPKYLSVQGEFIYRINILYGKLIILVNEAPVRIDRDPYLETLYLQSPDDVKHHPNPKVLIASKGDGIVMWEYMERERVTLEEVGEQVW